MGARVAIGPLRQPRGVTEPARIDIRSDRHGQYFLIEINPQRLISAEVIDVRPQDRHLLLMLRQRTAGTVADRLTKQKFLCGHDERAWFVAAVPETASAATVQGAMEALKPAGVLRSLEHQRVKWRDRNRRRNRAFVRQGEWFFIPRPEMTVDSKLLLRNEPLRRGAGKPHIADLAYREGGELVYVSHVAPNGYTPTAYRAWLDRNPDLRAKVRWSPMRRNARVFVRGRIRHPDHKTILLQDWHEVQMNTETQAQAMRHVAFLD